MTEDISSADYDAFRELLQDACGIVLGENKAYLVNSRLKKLLRETGLRNVRELVETLNHGQNRSLQLQIVDAMTTNETYWFRDNQPYELMKDLILPELVERKNVSAIRIWSAACSSGQEPYSLSMVADEYFYSRLRDKKQVSILATDISPSILAMARKGIYDELSLSRGLSEERRKRYFTKQGKHHRVSDDIRARVKFYELNLTKNFSQFGKFHVIFCRNVLIYFSTELKTDILNRLANCLEPGGYLFLGGSESMANYSDRFVTERHMGGLVYRTK